MFWLFSACGEHVPQRSGRVSRPVGLDNPERYTAFTQANLEEFQSVFTSLFR
jgi:hypothetical protein